MLIISHITFRDCRVHFFYNNLSWNSCICELRGHTYDFHIFHNFNKNYSSNLALLNTMLCCVEMAFKELTQTNSCFVKKKTKVQSEQQEWINEWNNFVDDRTADISSWNYTIFTLTVSLDVSIQRCQWQPLSVHSWAYHNPGGRGTQKSFTQGGSTFEVPHLNSLLFYIPMLTEKVSLSKW